LYLRYKLSTIYSIQRCKRSLRLKTPYTQNHNKYFHVILSDYCCCFHVLVNVSSTILSIYGSISLVDLGSFFQFLNLHTVGRTPRTGDQPVARPLPTHRTAETQNERTQTSMPRVGFESTIPVLERAKMVHALYARPLWSALTILVSAIPQKVQLKIHKLFCPLGGGTLKVNRYFWGICASICLSPACKLISCLGYSSDLKMGTTYSSETSVEFQRTTQRYILEDSKLSITTAVRTSNPI
jgi:hypothetical protein